MAIWFKIALALNVVYWIVFFYFLSRRRWNIPALGVGLFHMLFAAVVSVAPIRSLLDPDYVGYGVGVLQFEKRAVALPDALILAWALAAAWIAIGKGKGPWMKLVMLGDLFFGLSMSIALVLDNPTNWKFQLGEQFTAEGMTGLIILLGFFTLPFFVSAVWAAKRSRSGGTPTPLASGMEEGPKRLKKDDKNPNDFRYSQSNA